MHYYKHIQYLKSMNNAEEKRREEKRREEMWRTFRMRRHQLLDCARLVPEHIRVIKKTNDVSRFHLSHTSMYKTAELCSPYLLYLVRCFLCRHVKRRQLAAALEKLAAEVWRGNVTRGAIGIGLYI